MTLIQQLNNILKEYAEGNKLSAYKKFKKLYLKNNKNIKMRYNLAVMQQEIGYIDEAESNYKYLIKNNQDLKSKINLYNIYISKNFFEEALKIIIGIENENQNISQVKQDKAYVLFRLKRYEDSIIECENLINLNKININLLNTLGLNYLLLKKYEESEKILLEAHEMDQNNIPVLNSLGRLNHETKESVKAEKYFKTALNLEPNVFETLNNFAGFYLEESKYLKAIELYKRAEILSPNNSIIINNISKALSSLGDDEDAEKYCKKALSIDSKNDDFKKTFSLILLKKYDFSKAWKYFDGRLGLSEFISKNSSLEIVRDKLPPKKDINLDSKILIIREQGVGDEILYGTMYNDLLYSYKNVTIECDPRILPLLRNSFKVEDSKKFVCLGKYSKNSVGLDNFDYVIYAGSLGKYFRNDKKSFSKKPYLKTIKNYKDSELELLLKNNKNFKIGLSWKSFKNRYAKDKSLELNSFNKILKKNNCIFFNLQYGDVYNELNEFSKTDKNKIITLKKLDLFNDFSGLANLLINLDIFITVSNSTAHLAGALGVKTYLIKPLNHASYHYWNYDNGKTPWYDSIKIISKEELDDQKFVDKLF